MSGQLGRPYNAINLVNGASWGWRGEVTEDLVAFNAITGSAGGGVYLGAGYDYALALNTIAHNVIDSPNGRGLILSASPAYLSRLSGNSIMFNDFRGCDDEISYSNADLLTTNSFSRNLGLEPPNQPDRGEPPVPE